MIGLPNRVQIFQVLAIVHIPSHCEAAAYVTEQPFLIGQLIGSFVIYAWPLWLPVVIS